MLYYLAVLLKPMIGPLNVLTYNTVRAGGAAVTGFLISLIIGPAVIRWLRAIKVGQHIRKEHVADLHALHKRKEGTPTMGGALIIIATVCTLLLWGRLTNRLLLLAMVVFCLLGAVGFADDFIKLRRKHNKGLSAKAKFAGQIAVGLALGIYLVVSPITPGRTRLARGDILDWSRLVTLVEQDLSHYGELQPFLREISPTPAPDAEQKEAVITALNSIIERTDLYALGILPTTMPNAEGRDLIRSHSGGLSFPEVQRLNRLLLEAAFPAVIAPNIPDLHTKVEIPGLKEVFLPLGMAYAVFVLLIIVGSSNAVNLTDGLDGLAIGASVISTMAYTAIAYVVSRADWSRYLFLIYVPEASELAVFGAALLGTGLGFLWFNSHPAEVFMGDTGSLALGGALGTMAILTKQELLLIVVGGLFVIEAGSVILQVVSFKLRGKRIFRMAPLHHHFELMGWSESKVTIRFWILALLFAMMSLAALKLR